MYCDDVGCEPVQRNTELSNTRAHTHIRAIIWCRREYVFGGWHWATRKEVWKKRAQTTKKVKQRLMQINSCDLCIANWYLFIYSFLSWVWVCSCVFLSFRIAPLGCGFSLLLFIDLHQSIRRWNRLRCGHGLTIPSFIRNLFVRPSSELCMCVWVGFVQHMRIRFRLYSLFIFFCCQHTSSSLRFSVLINAGIFFQDPHYTACAIIHWYDRNFT